MLGPTAVSAASGTASGFHRRCAGPIEASRDVLSTHNTSVQHHLEVDYDFSLTAVNPNKVTTLWYRKGNTTRLLHQCTTLAKAAKVGRPKDGGKDAKDLNSLRGRRRLRRWRRRSGSPRRGLWRWSSPWRFPFTCTWALSRSRPKGWPWPAR
ncbi:hypothetical protein ZWY2020_005634 [Hordeum vulgare]|nr:hypothetical protein ZWY2020_005634 [Hordeum vulgare]